MAILRGFPPSNTISPSIRITEKDLSFYPAEQTFHRAALVGFCSKGPINLPTAIRTQRQLNTVFGYPHPEESDPYLIYAAQQYLTIANELWVVRVADDDLVSDEAAETATIGVAPSGGRVIIQSDTAGSYTFTKDSFFRWKLNGVLASKQLVVELGTYTCAELVADLNEQLEVYDQDNSEAVDVDGIEFFCSTASKIGVRSTWAYGPDASIELMSVQDAVYGGAVADGNVTGLGTAMTRASESGTKDRYPYNGYTTEATWDFTSLEDMTLILVIDGTDNTNIDNVLQTIDLVDLEGAVRTTAQIVQEINGQIDDGTVSGGFFAVGGSVATGPDGMDLTTHAYYAADVVTLSTLHHGRDARMLIKSSSTADTMFGLANTTEVGTSPSGSSGDAAIETFGLVYGDSAEATDDDTFTLDADSAGIEGNNTQVVVTNDTGEGVFTLDVYSNGVQVESWGYLTKDQTSRYYVETFLALTSDFIRVEDNTDTQASPADGTYTLVGGSDGIPSDPDDQDAEIIGSALGFTGIYAVSEPEQVEIDLIATPGKASTSVVYALLDMCQNYRMDCMAIIDPPFGLTVREITQWQNGTHPLNTTRFDSDFGALYWPWLKMRDTYNRVDVWVPPSGSVMAVYARSDSLSDPWFAPAGAFRGIVPGIGDVFSRPTLEERDLMYGNRNCVNPIVQFSDVQSYTVWGQKTLQRRPTALDRVNVRRLMFVIEKRIRQASRSLLFEPHDDIFHSQFISIASSILDEVKVGRGIFDYFIKADWELNTPDVVDRNEFRAQIGVQPTKAVEFMFLEFSIHRTGDFTENTEQPFLD